MTLIKTSLLNAIAVSIKILTMLGINKALAIYVGPSGYAAIGQFQNAVQMITTLASGAINTGVTKYTAEFSDNETKQHVLWRTAGFIAVVGSVFTGLIINIFSSDLADWVFKDVTYGSVFRWLSISLVFFVLNTLLLAIINGQKDLYRYIAANIAGSIFALVITILMTILYGLYGALVALAVYQSLSFFVTLLFCTRARWFRVSFLIGRPNKIAAINLGKYTAMALISAACVPITHIMIRNHLIQSLGLQSAGQWEAMWRLSGAYLMLVTTTLSVYYLPRLSEIKELSAIKKEVIKGYQLILPVAIVIGCIIYLCRDFIIKILFTDEFASMEVLFRWQIIGDTLKIGSWLLAYLMLGKAMVKLFISTEIIFALVFYFLTVLLTSHFGLIGTAYAHALNYLMYWIVIAVAMFGTKSLCEN